MQTVDDILYRAATMADCSRVVTLLNACSRALRGNNAYSMAGLRQEWQTPGFELEQSARVALNPQNQIVGYVEVRDMAEPPLAPFVLAQVHPEYEGRGIGTHLMTWAEARARQAIARVPAEARVKMCTDVYRDHATALELVQNLGMVEANSFYEMSMSLETAPPAPKWPSHFTVRTYDETRDARVFFDTWRAAFRDHRGAVPGRDEDEVFAAWHHLATTDPNFDPTIWFLATAGEDIVGVIICRRAHEEDPYLGWVSRLGVRRKWRKQGIGLALLLHAAGEFHRRGMQRLALEVDANSLTGATRLYAGAGMEVVGEYVEMEKTLRPGVELRRLRPDETEDDAMVDDDAGDDDAGDDDENDDG